MAQNPLVGQGLLIIEASRSHSETTHSVGLLWMNDQLYAQTSTCTTHNIHNRQTYMPPTGFEPQSQQASGRAATGIGTLTCNTIYCLLLYFNVIKYVSLNDFLVVLSDIPEDGRESRNM